jgi:uncharacterized protein YegL
MSGGIKIKDGIFGTDAENYSQRVPCVVVMDCSYSMDGRPIESLNEGLKQFEQELKADDKARRSARVMLIRVGGFEGDVNEVGIRVPFQDVDSFSAPTEVASGSTPLGEGVLLGLKMIEEEKLHLRSQGLNYHRPWLFVMSDGAPSDIGIWEVACDEARKAASAKKVSVFPIAVDGGNTSELQKLTNRSVVKMNSVKFSEFFVWLSRSISGASGDTAENPAMAQGFEDWARA